MFCIKHFVPNIKIFPSRFHYYGNFLKSFSTSTGNDVVIEKLSDKHKGVTVFGINRPEVKNAIGANFLKEFEDGLNSVRHDKDTRVVVLRSLVPGVFCAGADLKERAKMRAEDVGPFVAKARAFITDLEALPVPVIVALDGGAFGGGLEIALACDLRIAADSAKLGLVETRLAIIPGAGGTQRLPRLIGVARAKELIYTAATINGKEAFDIGLVNSCVTQNENGDAAYHKALEMASKILPNGPIGVKMAKVAISKGAEVDINTGLSIEEACYAQVIPTKDRLEGLAAFKEKRKPVYKGE